MTELVRTPWGKGPDEVDYTWDGLPPYWYVCPRLRCSFILQMGASTGPTRLPGYGGVACGRAVIHECLDPEHTSPYKHSLAVPHSPGSVLEAFCRAVTK